MRVQILNLKSSDAWRLCENRAWMREKNTTYTKMGVKADRKDMLLRRQTSGKVAKDP